MINRGIKFETTACTNQKYVVLVTFATRLPCVPNTWVMGRVCGTMHVMQIQHTLPASTGYSLSTKQSREVHDAVLNMYQVVQIQHISWAVSIWCVYLYPFVSSCCAFGVHLYPFGVYIRLDYAYLPTSCRRRIFIFPHGLAVLDLGSVRQIHDRATMTGVNDTVQDDSLWKGVHQPVVQLIIDNLSSLQSS